MAASIGTSSSEAHQAASGHAQPPHTCTNCALARAQRVTCTMDAVKVSAHSWHLPNLSLVKMAAAHLWHCALVRGHSTAQAWL